MTYFVHDRLNTTETHYKAGPIKLVSSGKWDKWTAGEETDLQKYEKWYLTKVDCRSLKKGRLNSGYSFGGKNEIGSL